MEALISFNRVGGSNVDDFEAELREILGWETSSKIPDEVVLDAANLEYISSAGLRVLLRLAKDSKGLRMVNVQQTVQEILDMTGFSGIIKVEGHGE